MRIRITRNYYYNNGVTILNYKNSSQKEEEEMKYKIITKKVCPECGMEHTTKYDSIHTETYCKKCGLVLTAQYMQHNIIFPGLKTLIIKIPLDEEEKE